MKYRADIDRWVSRSGLIYYYNKHKDKLILCKPHDQHGYDTIWHKCWGKGVSTFVHRIVWETFNGPVPDGLQIDHKNNNRKCNDLDNLQLVTASENCKLKFVRGLKGHRTITSDFGRRFKACYGERTLTASNDPLYKRERGYFQYNGYLKYEKEHGLV